jgi:hypothetical protein
MYILNGRTKGDQKGAKYLYKLRKTDINKQNLNSFRKLHKKCLNRNYNKYKRSNVGKIKSSKSLVLESIGKFRTVVKEMLFRHN